MGGAVWLAESISRNVFETYGTKPEHMWEILHTNAPA